jgi:hypothetical protein
MESRTECGSERQVPWVWLSELVEVSAVVVRLAMAMDVEVL